MPPMFFYHPVRISFRIMSLHRQITHLSSNIAPAYAMRAISIIVESAAIYTLVLAGALFSNRVNSFANFVFFDCTPPTIVNRGLVFPYIIIRVSHSTGYEEQPTNATLLDRTPDVQVRLDCKTETDTTRISSNYGVKQAEVMV
ncbi:hypothetical protein MSAN_02365700 [Mycena sanguinolenta]|uniref:Uncharacterized protein n=1 Tax=Mycena sanguinolenta TaxID=230812 RepID=A0A8H6X627_9AGAR|nr:hypothetical protein MSAN_02365700 [Mycena sanguinolenta]